jgi:hypothetical protein
MLSLVLLLFTSMCLRCTWHEALSCSVWIDSYVDMFRLGLIYLSIYLSIYMMVDEMHTWSPDWKRVVIMLLLLLPLLDVG